MRGRLIGVIMALALMVPAVAPANAGVPGFGPLTDKLFRLTFQAQITTHWDWPSHPEGNEPCVADVSGHGRQTVEFPKRTNPYQVVPYSKGDPFTMQPYHGDGGGISEVKVTRNGDIFHDEPANPMCPDSYHEPNDGCGTWHQDWNLTAVDFTPNEVRPQPFALPRGGSHPCPFFGALGNGAEEGPAFSNAPPFVQEKFPHAEHVLKHHDVTIIKGKQSFHRKAHYTGDTPIDTHATVEWTLRIKRLKG
jgi:hypothetical protein